MTDKTKYQLLQASSDDHNNSHQLNLLDLSPPDYNQSSKLSLPPTNPPRAMASLLTTRSRFASLTESRKQAFAAMVMLFTFISTGTLSLMLYDVFASSDWDTRRTWHLMAMVGPFIQTINNFLHFIECRASDDPLKLGDLENGNQENGNQENGNQENANQENASRKNNNPVYFWPLWIYSGPLLLIMMIVFTLRAPVTMVIAVSAYLVLNLVFFLTVWFRFDQENTNKDFGLGLAGNISLGMMAMLLLMGGIAEGLSTPAASAPGVSLGA